MGFIEEYVIPWGDVEVGGQTVESFLSLLAVGLTSNGFTLPHGCVG